MAVEGKWSKTNAFFDMLKLMEPGQCVDVDWNTLLDLYVPKMDPFKEPTASEKVGWLTRETMNILRGTTYEVAQIADPPLFRITRRV